MESGKFIGQLMHSRVSMHLVHWNTQGITTHEALGEYYEKLDSLLDNFVESYFGAEGRKKVFVPMVVLESPVEHLKGIRKMVTEERKNYSSDLQNILDEILGLINHTLYKLSFTFVNE